MENAATQDALWIERIRQSDYDAFAAMTRAYYPSLFDYTYSLTRSTQAAEDLVQDVLLKIWVGRYAWTPAGSAKAYLFRAVRNRGLNYLRDQKPRQYEDLTVAETIAHPNASPGADLDYQALKQAYRVAVDELPERRRQVFQLSRLYGLTYDEIGAILNISINTVRTQMTAALKHVRDRLSGYLG